MRRASRNETELGESIRREALVCVCVRACVRVRIVCVRVRVGCAR